VDGFILLSCNIGEETKRKGKWLWKWNGVLSHYSFFCFGSVYRCT